MKTKWLLVCFSLFLLYGGLTAQGLSGTFHLEGIQVQYHDVARDSGNADNDIGGTNIMALSWPSALAPMFQYPVAEFNTGDTIAAPVTPDYLLTPEGLAAVGLDLTITLNSDGTFEIPTSTYPTTTTENCSTYAYIPTIQDAGTYEWDGNDDGGGFGVIESNIFDLFSKNQNDENHGWVTIGRDGDGNIESILIEWDATDGPDSDSGIDSEGNLNRVMGVAELPADSGFVAGLNAAYGLSLPEGSFPTAGDNWPYDEEITANWMYLFDPAGDDGVLFSGDELLQFTSYYFTYNDMVAIATFTGAFEQYYGQTGDLTASVQYAAVATLTTFGVSEDVANALVSAVSDYFLSLMGMGYDVEDALIATAVYAIGAAMEATGGEWVFPDDSDHDYSPTAGNGRLLFEMGNQCVWDKQTRVVYAYLENVEGSVEHDGEMIPESFTLQGNYPNPFNPATNIVFDLDMSADVKVTIYSVLGQEINTIYHSYSEPGRYTVTWRGKDEFGSSVPSGVYVYKVSADNRELTGKMLLIK